MCACTPDQKLSLQIFLHVSRCKNVLDGASLVLNTADVVLQIAMPEVHELCKCKFLAVINFQLTNYFTVINAVD